MELVKRKESAAALSALSNTTLVVLKLVVGIMTGAMSVISEAIHSLGDLLASFLALFSVSKASEPADYEHPFGHGKYEDFSGLIEGALIILAALYICYESAKKFLQPESIEPLETKWGIIVMAFAAVVNFLLSRYLYKVAKDTDSMALLADAEHLNTDVLSSVAVFGGLLAIKLTSCYYLDAIIAFFVAAIIINSGYTICKNALNNLLDGSLPEEELEKINIVLAAHIGNDIEACSSIQTRKSGAVRTINLVLEVRPDMTISDGHEICDKIEAEIKQYFSGAQIVIHLEPRAVSVLV